MVRSLEKEKVMLKFLKRPFCKHEYKICTFAYNILGDIGIFPCTDIAGKSLYECKKCGKKIVKKEKE